MSANRMASIDGAGLIADPILAPSSRARMRVKLALEPQVSRPVANYRVAQSWRSRLGRAPFIIPQLAGVGTKSVPQRPAGEVRSVRASCSVSALLRELGLEAE